jgi:hypothetical protein
LLGIADIAASRGDWRMIDKTFGRWTVIAAAGSSKYGRLWLCRCDCGTEKPVLGQSLRSGASSSCGCFRKERGIEANTKHGLTPSGTKPSPEYRVWNAMISRCYNENHKQYRNYGGRGIVVSDEWRRNFEVFLADVGPRPSARHSLDRKDNDGDYCRDNCRWALPLEQQNNKRNTLRIDGVPFTELARKRGVPEDGLDRVRARIRQLGWELEEALDR